MLERVVDLFTSWKIYTTFCRLQQFGGWSPNALCGAFGGRVMAETSKIQNAPWTISKSSCSIHYFYGQLIWISYF